MTFFLPVETKARNESRREMKVDVVVMHAICDVPMFFLNYMKCSLFFRYYICVFDINLFILNEDLFICRQPTPVASNTDAS